MSDPVTVKKPLAFSFGKTKPKINLVKTESQKAFDQGVPTQSNHELITGLEGNKIRSVNKPVEKKGPLIIPCQKNDLSFKIPDKNEKKLDKNCETSSEDAEVLNALLADSKGQTNKKPDADLSIPADQIDNNKKEIKIVEPDYEEINIESFGLAALRGMGWSEKGGLGLNKRQSDVIEVECRPRGLGLGAGSSKKKKTEEIEAKNAEDGLRYIKGAYVQITNGKNENEYGKIVSFGDGLSRIIVELNNGDDKFSVLQACTKLVTRHEYKRATEKSSSSSSSRR